jgi:hypothetical protein
VTFSRRTLLSTLALMLPAVAAEAAKPRKPAAKAHHVAKAAPHSKAAKTHKVARRHHPATKPAVKQS